jgi:hypothetical protein
MAMAIILKDTKAMSVCSPRLKKLNPDGFLMQTDLDAEMSTKTVFQTPQMIGLHILTDSLMRSRLTKANGSTLTTTATATISNISMVRRSASLTAATVAEPHLELRPSTAGVALTATKTAGQTQPILGWPAPVETAMLGQWIIHSGTTLTVMAEAITHSDQLQMFAQAKQVHRLAHPLAVIAGVALIPMVTDGQTSVMHSFTSQLNGETPMAMVLVTMLVAIKETHAPKSEAPPFSIDWVAEIPMVTVGQTLLKVGKLILTELLIHSLLNRCNGEIRTTTGLVMFHWAHCAMIAQKPPVIQCVTHKVASIQTATVGRIHTVNSQLLSLYSAKTPRHLG